MQLSRTWIDTNLSNAQRARLVEWLMERSQHPTGEQILEGLRELSIGPDLPSVQSCIAWRNKCWSFELSRMQFKEDSQAATILADAAGDQIAHANKKMLDGMIFNKLRALREGSEVDLSEVHDLILSAARSTQAVMRKQKTDAEIDLLKSRLQQLEAEAEERAAKRADLEARKQSLQSKGGVTEETLRIVEEAIGLL